MYAMPEAEAYCYVCECADGTAFVLAFITNPVTVVPEAEAKIDGKPDEESIPESDEAGPSFKGSRAPMEPGDIFLGTIDGNHVIVRRGGMVQIGATALSQRIYLPVENLIRDYFQRYQALSPVGEIEWGHAVLVEGEEPTHQEGYLASGEQGDASAADAAALVKALKVAAETPVMVKYNIKDLCQEDVSKGKYTVELRVGRLTEDQLDPEDDPEHLFAQADHKAGTEPRTEEPVYPERDNGGKKKGIKKEERGVLSFTIYSHDEKDDQDKPLSDAKRVRYVFQLSRDGDNLIFTRGNIHVEVVQTVYANVREGVKVVFGDGGGSKVAGDNKQSVIELLKDNNFKAQVKAWLVECLDEMDLKVEKDIKLQGKANIQLGPDGDLQGVVMVDDLQTWFTSTFATITGAGPGKIDPACLTGFPEAVASLTVKTKK
jgi:hypothetical protein